jgi:cyclohexa-1,5-dienecarbonyl-CoA hydratase
MNNIELTQSGELARIVLRRPPLNYLNLELLQEFETQLEGIGGQPQCRALILEAEGKAFSAGLDMAEQTREKIFLLIEQFHRVARALNSFPRPTIAIVRGIAVGAGNELAACCDFTVASEGASFGQPEIKFGSIPSLAPLLLPPLVGARRAIEMIATGELVGAADAHKSGLIHTVVSEEKIGSAIESVVAKFRRLSLPVLEIALESARAARTRALDDGLRDAESLYLNRLIDLEDWSEGIQAFLEKRAPKWK